MKSFLHRLEVKFVLIATIIVLIGAVIINSIVYSYEYHEHYEIVTNRAKLSTSIIADAIQGILRQHFKGFNKAVQIQLDDLLNEITGEKSEYKCAAIIYDQNLKPVFTYGDTLVPLIPPPSLTLFTANKDSIVNLGKMVDQTGFLTAYRPLTLGKEQRGYLAVTMNYDLAEAGLRQLLFNLITITVFVTVISIFIAILIARKLAQPIKKLARETELVEAPHYTTSLKKTRQDEIGILQEQFLVMLNRLRKTEAEKEQTRQTLIQTEKMASIGTIASGVAHEINNPLAGLKQSISRIINDPGNVNQTKKYGSMILEALLHIENVVRGLLDFSKKRELNFKNIDLKRVLEDSVNMLQYEFKRKHIRLQKQFSKQPALVSGNIYYLKQVFINLLLNAIQAIPKSGDVIVRTLVNGNDIIVEVEDTGIGIEASKLDKIFNPFFTTKGEEEGTGLGLPICYSIIHDHGGDITVTSQVGVGTKFAVTLPHV